MYYYVSVHILIDYWWVSIIINGINKSIYQIPMGIKLIIITIGYKYLRPSRIIIIEKCF